MFLFGIFTDDFALEIPFETGLHTMYKYNCAALDWSGVLELDSPLTICLWRCDTVFA